MNSFSFYNPTKIVFGKDCVQSLADDLANYGQTILLTYGGGSIKRNGIYDAVKTQLAKANKTVIELSGIMSNPRLSKVLEGSKLCKEHKVDFILAVGGGSTLDCSKFIAAAATLENSEDVWTNYFVNQEEVKSALPLGAILTMAATGSEMNCGGVITNWETQEKYGARGSVLYPKFSYLDPTYTYTLPKEQMIYGIVDMLSHLMEQYFSTPDESNVSDDLIEAVFKSIMKNTEIAIKNPNDYTARSNIMWDATLALNGLLRLGKDEDWITHQIEHSLSAFYDIPHGAGLAIVHPMFLKFIYKNHLPRFVRFAKNIWHIDPTNKTDEEIALAGLTALRNYFHTIGAPTTLKEVNIPVDNLLAVAEKARRFPTSYSNMNTESILKVLQSCAE